jgi:hypothetical protein
VNNNDVGVRILSELREGISTFVNLLAAFLFVKGKEREKGVSMTFYFVF